MKTKLFSLALLLFTIVFSSCGNDDESDAVAPPVVTNAGFTWSENGGAVMTADVVYFESAYNTIKASKGTRGAADFKFVEINLAAATPATYAIGSGNAVGTLAGYGATAGNIVLTSNTSGKMSGTVTSTGSGASTTKLDATFTDIEVR